MFLRPPLAGYNLRTEPCRYLADHNAPEHRYKPQIVGSCFGAQVIAEALGGHVTKNPRGKYVVKAEEIYIQVRCSNHNRMQLVDV